MNFGLLVCFVPLVINNGVLSELIVNEIHKYFSSDLHAEFSNVWDKYKASFENSIKKTLQETFGRKSVNVFRQVYEETNVLAEGLYFEDDEVGLLLQNLSMRDMPFLRQPDVTFNLPDHELRVDGTLSKIIVEASYMIFRNRSSIQHIYNIELDTSQQSPQSPFRSSQVHTRGLVTIVAEDCSINGDTIATLSYTMVHLLQDGFKVEKCKFRIEIYRPGTGNPPVMAPYFSLEQGTIIERILTPVIASELMRNLEGVVMATVNTTAIFGRELISKIRPIQKDVMRKSYFYLRNLVAHMNLQTRMTNGGTLQPQPLRISWDDTEGASHMTQIIMDNMTLFGLESAYSSAKGGLLKNPVIKISDKIRFSRMQVRGQILWKDNSTKGTAQNHEFSLEMKDFAVAIKLIVDEGRQNAVGLEVKEFKVLGWRTEIYSALDAGTGRSLANALAIGYLNEALPTLLIQHYYSIFEKAVLEVEDDPSKFNITGSQKDKKLIWSPLIPAVLALVRPAIRPALVAAGNLIKKEIVKPVGNLIADSIIKPMVKEAVVAAANSMVKPAVQAAGFGVGVVAGTHAVKAVKEGIETLARN